MVSAEDDLTAGSAQEVSEALDVALEAAPDAIAQSVADSIADVENLEVAPVDEIAIQLAADSGFSVEIPADYDNPVTLTAQDGLALEVDLPGNARAAEVAEDGSVVYGEADTNTDIVVQAQAAGGVRMIVLVDGSAAPTTFSFASFATHLAGEANRALQPDGSVLNISSEGIPTYSVPKPWAFDAEGHPVPTWYTVTDRNILTLHVDHAATNA